MEVYPYLMVSMILGGLFFLFCLLVVFFVLSATLGEMEAFLLFLGWLLQLPSQILGLLKRSFRTIFRSLNMI